MARAHHLRALTLCRQLGDQSSLPSILCDIAHVSLDLGDTLAACDAAEEAFAIATELENLVGITNSLDALGRCRLAQGEPGIAVELWAEADLLRVQLGLPVERRHPTRARPRSRLGPDEPWPGALRAPLGHGDTVASTQDLGRSRRLTPRRPRRPCCRARAVHVIELNGTLGFAQCSSTSTQGPGA